MSEMDDARIEEIWEEMNGYVLELSLKPSTLGPRYLQDLIATCRNYLNKVSLRLSELNQVRYKIDRELKKAEALYEMEFDRLMASDERVKRLANVDDRKSTAKYILREQLETVHGLKDQIRAIDAVYRTVIHRRDGLEGTMGTIKEQRRHMEMELSTGSFYGDERTGQGVSSVGMGLGPAGEDLEEEEVQKIIAAVSAETQEDEAIDLMPEQPEVPASPALPPAPVAPASDEQPEVPESPALPPAPVAPASDEQALALFLADAPPPVISEPIQAEPVFLDKPPNVDPIAAPLPQPTVQPKSALQAEVEDLSSLLDLV